MRLSLTVAAAALSLLAAAPLTACQTLQESPLAQTLVDDKAILAAEAAYFGVATSAELAVDAGVLQGDRAAQVAVLDRQAYQALQAARLAYAAGNQLGAQAAAARALGAVADLQRILHPRPG